MNKISFGSLMALLAGLMVISGAAAQGWDGGTATNNDDGGNDNPGGTVGPASTSDDSTSDDTSSDSFSGGTAGSDDSYSTTGQTTETSGGWDGGTATNNDDGTSTNQQWNGSNATNNDDGSGTTTTWDGGTATNDDNGDNDSTQWDGGNATNDDDGGSEDNNTGSTDEGNNENNEQASQQSSGSGETNYYTYNIDRGPDIRFELSPTPATVDESVEVTGTTNQSNREVEIQFDSRTVAETETDEEGRFEASFTPESTGAHAVTVRSSGNYEERILRVNGAAQTVQISNINSRVTQNSPSTAIVCADVESEGTPDVKLIEDGNVLQTKSETGRVCFNQRVSNGMHQFNVVGEVDGGSDEASTTVYVEDNMDTSTRDTGTTGSTGSFESENDGGILAGIVSPLAQAFASVVSIISSLIPI